MSYAWREIEAKTESTGDTALAGAIGTKNHVQIGPRVELDEVVGDEVLELDAYNGARDVSRAPSEL